MKRLRIFPLVFLAALVVQVAAHAQSNETLPAQQCQSFSDCTLVWGGCGDVAINKSYVSQFKPSAVCAVTKAHDPKAVPTCEDKKCVVATPNKGGEQ